MKQKWKPRGQSFNDALSYMKGRRTGEITSLKTRWDSFNHAGLDGIEWHSTVIIGGRPGALKSAIKDQIIRDAFEYNKNEKFKVLDFQFEMVARVTALRELSAAVKKSYKNLCSADGLLSREDYIACQEYAKDKADYNKYPVDVVEEACSINDFGQIIDEYMEVNKTPDGNYVKTLIAVDHSILFDSMDETDLNKMLLQLGKKLTAKKRKYPIIFIVLSQLNRNIEQSGRNDQKNYGNYVVSSDFYGSDGLLMHADMMIGLDRPYLRNITIYGPQGYIVNEETVLVLRWIKCRNGEGQLSFFKVDFESMTIHSTEPPPVARIMKPTKTVN